MLRLIPSLLAVLTWQAMPAAAAIDPGVLKELAAEESDSKIAAIRRLAAEESREAARILQALSEDSVQMSGDKVVLLEGERVLDATTGDEITPAPEDLEPIVLNNRVRRELGLAIAVHKLTAPDRQERLGAARDLAADADFEMAPVLARAVQRETDREVKNLLVLAHAQADLKNPDPAARLAAVDSLRKSDSPSVKVMLARILEDGAEPDEGVRRAARVSLDAVSNRLAAGEVIAGVFSGFSLGSILLLAALGLAITYGVMGVINMAHGELLMVGAYATYATQTFVARHFPGASDWYLPIAIPVAFFAAATVGVLMERTVIRFLYRRPLETLLATWGLSLLLVQSARTLFGAQNVTVANPSWMSGGVEIMANAVLPWNRIFIILFSMAVLAAVWLLLKHTRLGLFVRAVTQNRSMAGCAGIATGRVDALAFALGAGLAGLGGVALSQYTNVGPDMGQAYIVDSFMVVVLGGVGQIAGAASAALGLGVVSKFLEGWSGAVIAKIMVLAFVIVFIQKRPQGIFALKGRTVED